MKFSWEERQQAIDGCAGRTAELLVVGGGVAGCSLAAHAARLGLDCVLIEREDFGAHASGNSTGLAHAGLRYLAQGRIGYVYQEARERLLLERLAPHWVRPFPFLLPVYRGDPYGLRRIRWGTTLYQWIYRAAAFSVGIRAVPDWQALTAAALRARVPTLEPMGLLGGAEYCVDAHLVDSRFTLGFAQRAAESGASLITRAKLVAFIARAGRLSGAIVRDEMTQAEFEIRARLIVNAAGAWIDEVRAMAGLEDPVLQNSGGIHLMVDRLADYPLIFATPVPGQVFFVIPAGRRSLVGTTDTPLAAPADAFHPSSAEMRHLVRTLFRFFPGVRRSGSDEASAIRAYLAKHAHAVYWAVRPLVRHDGATLRASRHHRLIKDANGLWSLPGVKLTAARLAGEHTAREAWRCLRGRPVPAGNGLTRLPGGEIGEFPGYLEQAVKQNGGRSREQLSYLIGCYGSRYREVLRWADAEAVYRDRVLPDEVWIYAEVAYAAHRELVLTLGDFLWRRARWALLRELPDAVIVRIARILGNYLNWSGPQLEQQLGAFRREQQAHRVRWNDSS